MTFLRSTDAELKGTLWWSAAQPDMVTPSKDKHFAQRVGLIATERLLRAIEPECSVLLLTPTNWRLAVALSLVDVIIVEPCLADGTGTWGRHLFDAACAGTELALLAAQARTVAVPVFGWFTADVVYYDLQSGFASFCDSVFCSDASFAARLRADGYSAEHLPVTIQPHLHNPFTSIEDHALIAPELLFDGWPSIMNSRPLADALATMVPLGLRIVESRATVRGKKFTERPALSDSVLGCVTPRNRLLLLKRAKVLLQAEEDATPRQQAEELAVEAAACRTVVVYHGQLPAHDARNRFAKVFANWADLRMFVSRLQVDQLLWMKEAQLAWRAAHLHHPVALALARIFGETVASPPTIRRLKATIVTPTFRPELLSKTIAQYRSQSWIDKELIVVANTSDPSAWDSNLLDTSNGEQIIFLPRSHWAGTALNIGAMRASGDYVFRMDDDDHYGPNYVHDMCLHAMSCDAEVLGKCSAFVRSEEHGTVFQRFNNIFPPTIFPASKHNFREAFISGFTVCVRSSFLKENGFADRAFAFADTAMINRASNSNRTFATCDPLNAVFERRVDTASHTWTIAMDFKNSKFRSICSEPSGLFV